MKGPGEFRIDMRAMTRVLNVRLQYGMEAAYFVWEKNENDVMESAHEADEDEERYCEDCGQRLSSYALDMGYTSCKCCMDGVHES